MSGDEIENLLYQGFQGRFLEEGVRHFEPLQSSNSSLTIDVRAIVIALAMRQAVNGRGDLCCPGPMSPGPALAFGATPLEFLRHLARKGTSPAAARAGGLTWTDLRRGLIGWDGPPGVMTQVLAGAGLTFAQRGEDRTALVFEKESALDTGGWHEGINFAAARSAPVIVVLVASGSDRTRRSYTIDGMAQAYGIAAASIGNESHGSIYAVVRAARGRATTGEGPTLVALRGIGDENRWASHDAFAKRALAEGNITEAKLASIERAAAAGVDHALGRIAKEPGPAAEDALAAVRTGSPPARPWTRLRSPRPDGVDGTPLEGPNVH